MPSADCLAAIVGIATNPLQGVVLFVSSGSYRNSCLGHDNPNTPRMLLSRFSSFRRCFPQSRRLSRGTPMLLSMRNCQVYERDISITGGLILVLHSRPCSFAYTYRRAVSSIPSTLFDQPAYLRQASFNPLLRDESLPCRYTSALSTCDWTNSLIRTKFLLIYCQCLLTTI